MLLKEAVLTNQTDHIDHIDHKKVLEILKEHHIDRYTKEINKTKKTVLVMDDDKIMGKLVAYDFTYMKELSELLNQDEDEFKDTEPSMYQRAKEKGILEKIKKFKDCDFELIVLNSNFAALLAMDLLFSGVVFDYAILDILVSGGLINSDDDLTGISVAYEIKKRNPFVKFKFYSGCALQKNFRELNEFQKLFPENDIQDFLIPKNSDLDGKHLTLFDMLID